MELGQRLKEARLEMGLSQRQLCGDEITRNMLSQIENGSARPSMDTLRYLAGRLGKPLSYFLEEDGAVSPNGRTMERARGAFRQGNAGEVLAALENYTPPDPLFDEEKGLLEVLARLDLARQAVDQGRLPYARQLLEGCEGVDSIYYGPELQRQRLLLTAKADPERLFAAVDQLPGLDAELILRAEVALKSGDLSRALALLDALEDRQRPAACLLRGQVYFYWGEYKTAAPELSRAEEDFSEKALPLLEQCYRELEDYKMAYLYACKQRE